MGQAFWRYFGAQAVSNLGTHIGRMALLFLLDDLTGSTLAIGALYLVSAIPENLLRLLGAPLIDRLPRLKLMAFLDFARFAVYIIPWILFQTGAPTIWILYLLAFASGLANALYSPATMAVVPSLVPPERLEKANSLLWTFVQSLGVLGPMVGVAVCTLVGKQNALLLDGLSFGLCGLTLALTMKEPAITATPRTGLRGYRAELVEGFTIYRQIPALLSITLVLALSNIGSIGSVAMLLPLVRHSLGAEQSLLGPIETGWAVGAIGASLLAAFVILPIRRRFLMLGGLMLIQLAQIIGGLLTPKYAFVMIGAWALFGFGSSTYSIQSQTIYQRLVPDRLRGRVMSVRMLASLGPQPIGQFLGTLIATRWDPAMAFLVGGGIPLLVTLGALFLPSIRALDRLEEPAEELSPAAKQGAPVARANPSQ